MSGPVNGAQEESEICISNVVWPENKWNIHNKLALTLGVGVNIKTIGLLHIFAS